MAPAVRMAAVVARPVTFVSFGPIDMVARAFAYFERSRKVAPENLSHIPRCAYYGVNAPSDKKLLRPRTHAACDDTRDPQFR